MFVLPPTETQTMEGVSMRCEISRMSVFVRQHVQNTSLNFHLFINCYGLFSFNSWQFLQHSNLSMYSNNSQLNTHYSLQYTAPGKNLYRCTVISQSKQMAPVEWKSPSLLSQVSYGTTGRGRGLNCQTRSTVSRCWQWDSVHNQHLLFTRMYYTGGQPSLKVVNLKGRD